MLFTRVPDATPRPTTKRGLTGARPKPAQRPTGLFLAFPPVGEPSLVVAPYSSGTASARNAASPDEAVLVQLLDEGRAGDAEAPGGFALVALGGRKLLGDDGALEVLYTRAQRVVGARIATL